MRRVRPSVALLGGLAGAAVAALYLAKPGRSVSTAVADLGGLLSGTIHLSDAQRAMVEVIQQELEAAGLAWLGPAAVANAYAESRLNPLAIANEPTGGQSVGLFQLYDNGAGAGMSVADRQDPHRNTQGIIAAVHSSGLLSRSGLTNAQWAAAWAELVEVCDTCGPGGQQNTYRAGLVAQLFGPDVAAQVPA